MSKRRATGDSVGVDTDTPRKSRRLAQATQSAETPSKKSILRRTPSKINGTGEVETPKGLRRVLFSTPAKPPENATEPGAEEETPAAVKNERSARRKSAKTLINQSAHEDASEDEEEHAQDSIVARIVLGEEVLEDREDGAGTEPPEAADTPSKARRPRGRPRERTPSPPPDLPPHELYFFQNRAATNKTSSNTLPPGALLKHEDYVTQIRQYRDPHQTDLRRLKNYHQRAFDQWLFELEEGFSLCLHGYGSKRALAMEFAEHWYAQADDAPKIIVVNGYAPGLTVRDVLTTMADAVLPKTTKQPAQPAALIDMLFTHLCNNPASIGLIVHSLDHANLRKGGTQSLLARLAAHPSIFLLATCDTPNVPLLWDTNLTRQFNWLYHDATTFEPYTSELHVVHDVNSLLGRNTGHVGGKDGVTYVLKSLPENARNLFRILVVDQLALTDSPPAPNAVPPQIADDDADDADLLGASDEEAAAHAQGTPSRRGRKGRAAKPAQPARAAATAPGEGVEYRALYLKAVEQFVCSSEVNFRTLLKEFHDHRMIESRKDGAGTERLAVPIGREELEAWLEEEGGG